MMLKVLLYSYGTGTFSSRKIAAKLETDVALRVLGGGLFPDFRTICRFRTRHHDDFVKVFVQVVQIAKEAGLVKLGTLAVDGSKIRANASKHRAMSYGRMKEEETKLRREIRKLLAAAKKQDSLDDREFGPDFRGDELPQELARRESRLKTILEAKKRLELRKEEEAREDDERKAKKDEAEGRDPPRERPEGRKHPKGQPKPKDQENFTDPESRIMLDGSGAFQQSYNAQIAVDAGARIIVGALVSNVAADARQLIPVLDRVEEVTGMCPRKVLADAGYRSEENFEALRARNIDGYVAVGRERSISASHARLPLTNAMARKLRTKKGRQTYRKRKHIAEPPFGWIKSVLGFRGFSMRGLRKVNAEWQLVCAAMNLRRLGGLVAWA